MSDEPIDQLLRDQIDFVQRLKADPYFADVTVLLEAKGVTEADIEQALATLNSTGGKIGACVIVLMPSLRPDTPDAPGPTARLRLTVQVIESPLLNRGEGGTGKPASAIALRVRTLLHFFANGQGATFSFAGEEPVPAGEGNVSTTVALERPHQDERVEKAATPMLDTEDDATAPALVTITAAPGAVIYYTTNGAYPAPGVTGAQIYAAPVQIDVPTILRAVAYETFKQASNVVQHNYGSARDFGADFSDDFAT